MKKTFIIFIFALLAIQSQAQVRVWREINLRTFPNNYLSGIEIGFTDVLFEGAKTGKIKVYPYTEKFARFANQPLPPKQVVKYLRYYDKSIKDSIDIRSVDLYKLELQEEYYPRKKGKRRFRIKKVTLWGGWDESHTFKLSFKYQDFKAFLNQTYQTSLKLKDLTHLAAYWQSPEDVTLQTSVPTALENRKFVSKVLKTEKLQKKHQVRFKQLTDYQPSKMKDWEIQPKFLRIDKNTLRATVQFKVNLKTAKNFPFYRLNQGIVDEIIKGVKAKKVNAYEYNSSPTWTFLLMKREDFIFKLSYYDDSVQDSIRLRPSDLYEMKVLGYWDLNTITQKTNFQIVKIDLMIPKGTNSATQLGPIHLASFKYEELKPYLEERFTQAKKAGRHYGTWIKPSNTLDRMSFAQALEKGLFTKRLIWYANQQDDGLIWIFNRANKGKKLDAEQALVRYQKMQEKTLSNLENFRVK